MPLLDHFHPPLHGPRRWEGFHHAWATYIATQLNQDVLPADYFAESQLKIGPDLVIEQSINDVDKHHWSPPRPKFDETVDFAQLDTCEIRVYQNLGGAELRGAIELVSPANKDRPGSRRTFAAKCAGYLKHGIGLVIIDVVTSRSANLHSEIFDILEVKSRRKMWESATGLYAVAYRPVTVLKNPRIEAWAETLTLGEVLPTLPLWLALDLCVPVALEASYNTTCGALRISGSNAYG